MGPDTSRRERLLVGAVSLVLLVRVLGVSLVLTVFPAHGATLTDSLLLVGAAFGVYGLSMALFQIPFGRLSDRIGRRPVLVGGILVSILGSVACAFAPTIEWLLLARFVQGAGAVNGVAMALVGDHVPDERRTRAMAVVGISIGGAFALGFILGPLLAPLVGISGLFLLQAGLGALALALILASLSGGAPDAPTTATPRLRDILATPDSGRMAVAAFAVAVAMNAATFAVPILALAVRPEEPGYRAMVPMVLLGGLILGLTARLADKGYRTPVARYGFLTLALAPAALVLAPTYALLVAAGVLFFAAHSTLSALLPTLASRIAGTEGRGALLGAYNVSQYLGSFVAGILAGALIGTPWAFALALGALGLAGLAAAVPLAKREPPARAAAPETAPLEAA